MTHPRWPAPTGSHSRATFRAPTPSRCGRESMTTSTPFRTGSPSSAPNNDASKTNAPISHGSHPCDCSHVPLFLGRGHTTGHFLIMISAWRVASRGCRANHTSDVTNADLRPDGPGPEHELR